ncbi:DUF2240 family protein [Candidatus Woesearchaeota archaeon]|nr:DUF2240 family protein [Candidatus Woesearchaeota archaeon]
MLTIPFDDILSKIREKTGLSDEEILKRIEQKTLQLSGLVSKDGAAHIVANELGVKLFQHGGRQKIKDIYPGLRSVETIGRVQQVYELRSFQRAEGTGGKVCSIVLADETGSIRVVGWGSHADTVAKLQPGVPLLIRQAYSRESNLGGRELHLNDNTLLTINPLNETVPEVKLGPERKAIKDLQENESGVELLGTIIQLYDPRFFEVCPKCQRRARPAEGGGFACETHGVVEQDYGMVFTIILDDGTGTTRCVFFRNQAEMLLGKTKDELISIKDVPEAFEPVKTDLLGTMIKVLGKVNKNQMFDRVEFMVNRVEKLTPEAVSTITERVL